MNTWYPVLQGSFLTPRPAFDFGSWRKNALIQFQDDFSAGASADPLLGRSVEQSSPPPRHAFDYETWRRIVIIPFQGDLYTPAAPAGAGADPLLCQSVEQSDDIEQVAEHQEMENVE